MPTVQISAKSDQRLPSYGDFGPKFGPSLGTLGPISKKIVRGLPPTMAGFVPKFQPSMTKIVGRVCVQRNKMATILYMYRYRLQVIMETCRRIPPFWMTKLQNSVCETGGEDRSIVKPQTKIV